MKSPFFLSFSLPLKKKILLCPPLCPAYTSNSLLSFLHTSAVYPLQGCFSSAGCRSLWLTFWTPTAGHATCLLHFTVLSPGSGMSTAPLTLLSTPPSTSSSDGPSSRSSAAEEGATSGNLNGKRGCELLLQLRHGAFSKQWPERYMLCVLYKLYSSSSRVKHGNGQTLRSAVNANIEGTLPFWLQQGLKLSFLNMAGIVFEQYYSSTETYTCI